MNGKRWRKSVQPDEPNFLLHAYTHFVFEMSQNQKEQPYLPKLYLHVSDHKDILERPEL